ncbi:MAG TPA: hypothetical protein VGR71_06015, partial [Nitrospira sp.]|nr:hypothetical protein [Nitrospira sp.]
QDGSFIDSTYASLGVTFIGAMAFNIYNSSAYPPNSGTGVITADLNSDSGTVQVFLRRPAANVTVYATTMYPLTLTCYNAAGAVVGMADVPDWPNVYGYEGGPPNYAMVVSGGGISTCVVQGTADWFALDDFTFQFARPTKPHISLTSDRQSLAPVIRPGTVFDVRTQIAGDTVGRHTLNPYFVVASRTDSVKLSVFVRDSAGRPLAGSVEIVAEAVDGGGGHEHSFGERPAGRFFQIGSNVATGDGVPDSIAASLDPSGKAHIIYRSSGISGSDRLVAYYHSGPQVASDSTDLQIGVQGLVELENDGNIDTIGVTTTHPSNHWGTGAMVSSIRALADALRPIADSIAALPPPASPEEFPRHLRVNDMSLPEGGLFDFKYSWANPHLTHRSGTDADVDVRRGAEWNFYYKTVYRIWVEQMGHWLANERNSANHVHLGY